MKKSKYNSWEALASLSSINLIRYVNYFCVSIPMLAAFIIVLDELTVSNMTVSRTQLILYFSSLLVVFCKVLYETLCPEIIKKHKNLENYFHFLKKQHSQEKYFGEHWKRNLDSFVQKHNLSNKSSSEGEIERIFKLLVEEEFIKQQTPSALKNNWEDQNERMPLLRKFIYWGYVSSGATGFCYFFILLPLRVLSVS